MAENIVTIVDNGSGLEIKQESLNDILEVNWSAWSQPGNTSKFQLCVMRPASQSSGDMNSNEFSKNNPILLRDFPKSTTKIRIQLTKYASELDSCKVGFALYALDSKGCQIGTVLAKSTFAHTPYFSCRTTNSSVNFIKGEQFRWDLSIIEKFKMISYPDMKTVLDKYKKVSIAMSLISSSPYTSIAANKMKDDCCCFEYNNEAYLMPKEFWLLYNILLNAKGVSKDLKSLNLQDSAKLAEIKTKYSQVSLNGNDLSMPSLNKLLHDDSTLSNEEFLELKKSGLNEINIITSLLEVELNEIWSKKFFYKLESTEAATLEWNRIPGVESYNLKRYSSSWDFPIPLCENLKATTYQDPSFRDAKGYLLEAGKKTYQYDCKVSPSPIVV